MNTGVRVAGLSAAKQPWRVSVTEPATGETFAEFEGGGARDADFASDVAARALPGWAGTPVSVRAAALQQIADRLRQSGTASELAELTVRETGKRLAEAQAEVGMTAAFFSWFAAAVTNRDDRLTRAVPGVRHQVSHRPLGVVAVSTPWNFPLSIPARKIAAALAAGCTVLFKPSELAPGSSLRLAEIVQEHVPDGVLGALLGDGAELTRVWLGDERVRGISFTGSTRVGLAVAELASQRLVRCVLELGGNAPFVVLDDADPLRAVELIGGAKFRNNGQSCIAANTVWVPRAMLGDVVDGLAAAADALVLGDPLRGSTTLGPLAPPADPRRVAELVADARRRGATVRHSPSALPDRGHYVAPVLAVDPPRDCRMVTEESFAPVLPILPYDDLDEVLSHTQRAPLGLAGYVAGTDVARATAVAEALDVGIVGVNTSTPNTPQIPFGGLKMSGIGWEGGQAGLDAFLAPQTIAVAQA